MPTERLAYICRHKDCVPPLRVFLAPGDSVPPRCPDHGTPMMRQTNLNYTRPDPSAPIGRSVTTKGQARRGAVDDATTEVE